AAGRVLPADRQQFLQVFEWLAIPAELIVVGLIVVKARQVARRMRTEGPADPGALFERMRDAAREVLGANLLSDTLAFEIALCHHAFAGWRARPVSSPETFTYHRRSAYGAMMAALLLGLYQAVRLRPIRIEEDRLLIRIGLKWRVEVPFEDVAAVEILRGGTVLPKRKALLRAVVLGDARY